MGIFDKATRFLKGEAADIGDAAEQLKDRFDEELTRREVELAKSPSEKIDDLQAKAAQTDNEFDRILAKADSEWTPAGEQAPAGDHPSDENLAAKPNPTDGANQPRDVEVDSGGASGSATGASTPASGSSRPAPNFAKSDAEVRYEQAREKADGLLDELRSELKDNGEI